VPKKFIYLSLPVYFRRVCDVLMFDGPASPLTPPKYYISNAQEKFCAWLASLHSSAYCSQHQLTEERLPRRCVFLERQPSLMKRVVLFPS